MVVGLQMRRITLIATDSSLDLMKRNATKYSRTQGIMDIYSFRPSSHHNSLCYDDQSLITSHSHNMIERPGVSQLITTFLTSTSP